MINVTTAEQGSAKVIAVTGEVDLYSSPKLREALNGLTDTKEARIVVDMSGVSYMDSSGLATLVEALQKTGGYKGAFSLASVTPEVLSVFQLSRLDQVFDIHETVDSAVSAEG
ncbi:MAG: STAS domain-containing protein [Calditrichota bacterium]